MNNIQEKIKNFKLTSSPRIPKSKKYWLKKGKSGKDVCLIFHDDLDGITSAIIMKNYLVRQGFNIVKYGIINYQEGWSAFKLDSKLITIALDFAEDLEGIDVYIDHHGTFNEGEQKSKGSIKTPTGSAAEGIAQQIGMPFSNDTKDWIDMIDSAKYDDYNIDIKDILDFNLTKIKKDKNAKLRFAATVNQLLKRSDHKTFIEVVNSSDYPSIYNIFRLFKIFYPKNNPDLKTGVEPGFVEDGIKRINTMILKTRGNIKDIGYDNNGNKIIYNTQSDFWNAFSQKLQVKDRDQNGNVIGNTMGTQKWQLKPKSYQIIGNLMYVPGGTWANALRAKSIFSQDMVKGIVPDNTKLNFVLLQYGNTLQIADLRTNIKDMNDEDYPKDINGIKIDDLSKYCDTLVENFKKYLGYKDERIKSGGHWGIGSISNIFGKCENKSYENLKFLDMFKNKIINDISGINFGLKMPWNESENDYQINIDEYNLKMLKISNIRTEKDVFIENNEKSILNKLIFDNNYNESLNIFKTEYIKKIYEIWLDTYFYDITSGNINVKCLSTLYFKKNKKVENTILFHKIIEKFNLTDIYKKEPTEKRKSQRKKLKSIINLMSEMINNKYIV